MERTTTRGRKFPGEPLTKAEVEALLARCSKRAPTGIRNRALITVLYRTGLRITEALDLKPSDVDLDNGTIRVLHGKGDAARTVGIDARTTDAIARWLDIRATYVGRNHGRRLFTTLDGQPVSDRYVRDMLKRLAKGAGIEKRVHPHGLRHTYAVELDRERHPVAAISQALGHHSIATTSRYLSHLAPADVIDMNRNREW